MLNDNQLTYLSALSQGLSSLETLSLNNNQLTHLYFNTLEIPDTLMKEDDNNPIERLLPTGTFQLPELKILTINGNQLTYLQGNVFQKLLNLQTLDLGYNDLRVLPYQIFHGIVRLESLSLNNNQLTVLPSIVFDGLLELSHLNLAKNSLNTLAPLLFKYCLVIRVIDLRENPLKWVNNEPFNPLEKTTVVLVDEYATCCFVTSANCSGDSAHSTQFLTCDRMLSNCFLRFAMWIIAIAAVTGNISVLYTRYTQKQQGHKVQLFLITNLAISDFMMGMYMLFLVSADLYFSEYFPNHSILWRYHPLCRAAGFLAVVSSEASVFIITCLSFDRFMGVVYPFGKCRFGIKKARIIICTLWCVALALGISLSAIAGNNQDLYDVSEVCIGLPLSRRIEYASDIPKENGVVTRGSAEVTKPSMYLSIAVFTGLNLLCFIVVSSCYMAIFISARQGANQAGRTNRQSEEIRMAMRMAAIVITDLCCWMPIICLSILVQSGVLVVKPQVYVWIATFILPINSSMNPFLYTLASAIVKRLQQKQTRTSDISMNRISIEASSLRKTLTELREQNEIKDAVITDQKIVIHEMNQELRPINDSLPTRRKSI